MKKTNWMKFGVIAILTVLSTACGRYGQVAGRTYIAGGGAYGAQTAYGYSNGYNPGYGYNNGYNGYGYNNGYAGYNNGYAGYGSVAASGESISFDNNGRATYRQSSGMQPISGSYSYLDGNNTQLQLVLDGGAQTGMVGMTGPLRFTVSNDGNTITNQNTGQVLYRQ